MKMPSAQKKLAAKLLKAGVSRVKILEPKEIEEAITREDFKRLIAKGVIVKKQKRGQCKKYAKYRLAQKKKGRRIRKGSWKGKKYAKKDSKEHWVDRVRALRRLLKELRDSGKIEKKVYRNVYHMIKGGSFRSKSHLLYYLKSNELIKSKKSVKDEKKS
jgi:large subunit ribosomal protein L19e